jgi:two-component system sensor histidine kinase VicK
MRFWKGFFKLLRSLQWKLVYIFISMCIILVSVVYVVINSGLQTIYYDSFKQGIETGYKNWTDYRGGLPDSTEDLSKYFTEGADEQFFGAISSFLGMTIIDVTKLNTPSKAILFSSEKGYTDDPVAFGDQLRVRESLMSIEAGNQSRENKKLLKGPEGQYFEYIIQPAEDKNLIFYFTYQEEAWKPILESFNNLIFLSALIAVFLSLFLGYLLSKTITSPIVSVMHKAEKVAQGEFDEQLAVKSEDEIGNLTKTFNYMAAELKKTLSEISSEKNKVETILNYMADGVMAFDLKGMAIHANPAARKLLGNEIVNLPFREFAENVGLDVKIEDIVYFEESPVRESDTILNDMYVKLYFAVFTDTNRKPEGIIVVLHDATEQQKLDNMRREFVANVSHELRTPITSIKSYTETLIDGAAEDAETSRRFLGVINSEADRMTRLVKDLLQLSRLDNQQMSWKIEDVSLDSMTKAIVERLQIEAGRKNQKLNSFVIGDIPTIRADKDRMEQVVVNLVSNAIKYTPENGEITVYVGKIYNDVYIKVTDTGIGIPSDSIPRVFERFYRVDKARSRDLGGTGLGLSIAKEIVQAHGGIISIASEIGKGTEVTVKLPTAV